MEKIIFEISEVQLETLVTELEQRMKCEVEQGSIEQEILLLIREKYKLYKSAKITLLMWVEKLSANSSMVSLMLVGGKSGISGLDPWGDRKTILADAEWEIRNIAKANQWILKEIF